VNRLAPSHESGRDGSSVHHPDAARPQKKTPELTLDRTVRLLQTAIKLPTVSLGMAIRLVEYHIRRNEIARKSHTKTWMAKHPKAICLLL
jgi:hypothetical protein